MEVNFIYIYIGCHNNSHSGRCNSTKENSTDLIKFYLTLSFFFTYWAIRFSSKPMTWFHFLTLQTHEILQGKLNRLSDYPQTRSTIPSFPPKEQGPSCYLQFPAMDGHRWHQQQNVTVILYALNHLNRFYPIKHCHCSSSENKQKYSKKLAPGALNTPQIFRCKHT